MNMNIHTSNIQAVMYNNQSFKRAYYGETLIFPSSPSGLQVRYLDIIDPTTKQTRVKIFSGNPRTSITDNDLKTIFWNGIDHIDLIDNKDKVVKRYTEADSSNFNFNVLFSLNDYSIYLYIDSNLISGYEPELAFYFKPNFGHSEIRFYTNFKKNDNIHYIEINTNIVSFINVNMFTPTYNVDKTRPIIYKFIGPNIISDKDISLYGIDGAIRNYKYTTIYIPKEYKDSYNTLLNALTEVPDSQKILY